MRFTRPKPAECSILGLPASVSYQIGIPTGSEEQGAVVFSRPTEGDDFEVVFNVDLLWRLVQEVDEAVNG